VRRLKPKFHYVDFRVTCATSQRQTRDAPVDFFATSPISPFLVDKRGLVADFSMGHLHLDMSRWFETPKLPHDFPLTSCPLLRNFAVTRIMGMFLASRRNGIWA